MLRYGFNGTPILTNPYRRDKYSLHLGEDYALEYRTAIIAKTGGIVIAVKGDEKRQWIANTHSDPFKPLGFPLRRRSLTTADYGNYVKIDHGVNPKNGKKVSTLYAHLDEVVVYPGKVVKEGELIGYADSKGNSTGHHLHEELRENDQVIDPTKFDYTFTNEIGGGTDVEISNMQDTIKVTAGMLNVRSGPAKMYPVSGSKLLRKGDIVNVVGFTEGESIDGNNLWYKSVKGNYFWAGGTDKPKPILPVVDKKDMTIQERDEKLKEFEAKRATNEARRAELEAAVEANKADIAAVEAEWEAFAAQPVEEPTPEPVVEEVVVEEVKEEVVETEKVVEVSEEEKSMVVKLQEQLDALKSKLGL